MRELKFKQAIKEQSAVGVTLPFHWHYWGYLGNEFDGLTLPLGRMDGDERLSYQYTGLKDKNGKEIYEGDILLADKNYTDGDYELKLQIKWDSDKAGFYLYDIDIDDSVEDDELYALDNCYEVIGNIYENSELLEAK